LNIQAAHSRQPRVFWFLFLGQVKGFSLLQARAKSSRSDPTHQSPAGLPVSTARSWPFPIPPGPLPAHPLLSTTSFTTWRRPFQTPQNPAYFMQVARPWRNSPIRFRYAPLLSAPAHPSRLATNMRPPSRCSSLRFHDSNRKRKGICIHQRTPAATQKPGHRSARHYKCIISHRD